MFQKQVMMRRVVYSLIPIFLFSIYLYGWRSLVITGVTFLVGILTEYFYMKAQGKKVSEASLVTCALYALSMPPMVPLWIVGFGIFFGLLFGKCIYGGFGRNIFNPAITGRLFVYVSFPAGLQRSFGQPGRFGTLLSLDSATSATPLEMMKEGISPSLTDLLTGIRMGALGESAALLILLAGIYLVVTKTANWRPILATILSFSAVTWLCSLLGIAPAGGVKPFLLQDSLLSGSILYVAVFMSTDPVTAPKKPGAVWLYGIIIGGITASVRIFALFPEGTSFGILLGNTFASLLDEVMPAAKKKKKPKKELAPAGGAK